MKTVRIKNTSIEIVWEGNLRKLSIRSSFFQKFKSRFFIVDRKIHKKWYVMIKEWFNIKIYFEEKLAENAESPKELRRTSKLPRLPNNKTPPLNICLKNKNDLMINFSFNRNFQEIVLVTCGKSCFKSSKTIK